jgi:hypothetical protein
MSQSAARAETRYLALEARANYERKLYEEMLLEYEALSDAVQQSRHSIRDRQSAITVHVIPSPSQSFQDAPVYESESCRLTECEVTYSRDLSLEPTPLSLDVQRVMTLAECKLQRCEMDIATLRQQLRALEAHDEDLLNRRGQALEKLGVPIGDVSIEETVLSESLCDLDLGEDEVRAALANKPENTTKSLALDEREIEKFENANRVRRSELVERVREVSAALANRICVQKTERIKRVVAVDLEEVHELIGSPECLMRVTDKWEARQRRNQEMEEEIEMIQEQFARVRQRIKNEMTPKIRKIKELRERIVVSHQIELVRSEIHDKNDELASIQESRAKIQSAWAQIRRGLSKAESRKAALAKDQSALSAKQQTVEDISKSLATRRSEIKQKVVSLRADEERLRDATMDVECLEQKVRYVESRIHDATARARAVLMVTHEFLASPPRNSTPKKAVCPQTP